MFILFSQDILGAIKDEFQQFKTLWIILKIKGNLGYKMKLAEILYPIHFFLHDCKNAQFFFNCMEQFASRYMQVLTQVRVYKIFEVRFEDERTLLDLFNLFLTDK